MKSWKLATAIAVSAISGSVIAADGSLGTTSTGSSALSVEKTSQAKITGIADYSPAAVSFVSGDITFSDDVCVFSSSGTYGILAASANASGSFALDDGGTTLAYTMTWDDGGGAVALTEEAVTSGNSGNNTDEDCGGAGVADNATWEITIAQADFNGVAAGTYTDTLTLTVSVE